MDFQFYLKKLHSSKEFKQFKEKNQETYFCGGFFVIDKDGKDNQKHIDFFNIKNKKITSFHVEKDIKMIPSDIQYEKSPEEILEEEKLNFNFKKIEQLITEEMKKQNVKNKIQKILVSLQKSNKKDFLICTVFISMLGLLKINISLKNLKIEEFEKKSIKDILRVSRKKKDK